MLGKILLTFYTNKIHLFYVIYELWYELFGSQPAATIVLENRNFIFICMNLIYYYIIQLYYIILKLYFQFS